MGAGQRCIGIGNGVVARRRLDAARQHGGFGQAQLIGMLAEEFFAGCFDAENPGAEINTVEIEGEDLILGITRLQIHRQHRFLRLAVEGTAGREEQVLGQLLRQGRAALHHMSRRHVGNAGADHADGIKTEMFAEAAILNGDKGVGDIGGKIRDLDHLALGQSAPCNQPSVIVQDGDVACRPGGQKIFDVRQVGKKIRIEDRAENRAPGEQHHQHKRPGGLALWRRLRRIIVVAARTPSAWRLTCWFSGGLCHARFIGPTGLTAVKDLAPLKGWDPGDNRHFP